MIKYTSIDKKNELFKEIQQQAIAKSKSENSSSKPFAQPELRNDKWSSKKKYICSEGSHDCSHDWEAFNIFFETQLKRLLRLLTLYLCNKFKYFAHNESDSNIYKFDSATALNDGEYAIQNVGHATQLIQLGKDINIITDPVFGDLNWILYPAKTKPGVAITDLPRLDAIIISHNHRDHVDAAALKKLVKLYPNVKIYVPEGDDKLFKSFGFKTENIHVTKWYETVEIEGQNNALATMTAVPADHWSGRGPFDVQHAATNGWIIGSQDQDGIFYFAGDSAKLSHDRMQDIAAILYSMYALRENDDIKLNMIMPDGPNRTRKMMESTHMSVIDAVQSGLELAMHIHSLESYLQKEGVTNKEHDIEWWMQHTTTLMMHHNKYELGPDTFNEGYYILQQIKNELNTAVSSERTLEELRAELGNKVKMEDGKWQVWLRKNDAFIYQGILDLISTAQQIWPETQGNIETINEKLSYHIDSIKWPKIGERINSNMVKP